MSSSLCAGELRPPELEGLDEMLTRADSQQGGQGDMDGFSPLMDSVATSHSSGPSQVSQRMSGLGNVESLRAES